MSRSFFLDGGPGNRVRVCVGGVGGEEGKGGGGGGGGGQERLSLNLDKVENVYH